MIFKKRWERPDRASCCQSCQREDSFQIDRSGIRKKLVSDKSTLYDEGIMCIHSHPSQLKTNGCRQPRTL